MKLTDKRFWIFEATMLLCGMATSYLYVLSFGIGIFDVPAIVLVYMLSYLLGGVIAWVVCKCKGRWTLAVNVSLFSSIVYFVLDVIIHLLYLSPYEGLEDLSSRQVGIYYITFPYEGLVKGILSSLLYWLLSAILPMTFFALIARRFCRL